MDLKNSIATLPSTTLSLVVFSAISGFLPLAFFWKTVIFSAFYFLLLIMLSKLIFWGKFEGRSLELDNTQYSVIIRAYSALIILMLFFGIGFLEMAKEAAVTAQGQLMTPLTTGLLMAVILSIIQHKLSMLLGINYTLSQVTFKNFDSYITWYHYIALFLLGILAYATYFTE